MGMDSAMTKLLTEAVENKLDSISEVDEFGRKLKRINSQARIIASKIFKLACGSDLRKTYPLPTFQLFRAGNQFKYLCDKEKLPGKLKKLLRNEARTRQHTLICDPDKHLGKSSKDVKVFREGPWVLGIFHNQTKASKKKKNSKIPDEVQRFMKIIEPVMKTAKPQLKGLVITIAYTFVSALLNVQFISLIAATGVVQILRSKSKDERMKKVKKALISLLFIVTICAIIVGRNYAAKNLILKIIDMLPYELQSMFHALSGWLSGKQGVVPDFLYNSPAGQYIRQGLSYFGFSAPSSPPGGKPAFFNNEPRLQESEDILNDTSLSNAEKRSRIRKMARKFAQDYHPDRNPNQSAEDKEIFKYFNANINDKARNLEV